MSSASKSSRSARSSAAARAASPHAGSTPPQPASPNVNRLPLRRIVEMRVQPRRALEVHVPPPHRAAAPALQPTRLHRLLLESQRLRLRLRLRLGLRLTLRLTLRLRLMPAETLGVALQTTPSMLRQGAHPVAAHLRLSPLVGYRRRVRSRLHVLQQLLQETLWTAQLARPRASLSFSAA